MEADELTSAVRDFVERIAALACGPDGPTPVQLDIGDAWQRTSFELTPAVAQAFAAALRAYHDPRDQGRCERCGGARLDANLICVDCGHPHGIFGQLLLERLSNQDGGPG